MILNPSEKKSEDQQDTEISAKEGELMKEKDDQMRVAKEMIAKRKRLSLQRLGNQRKLI